jgi:tRNA pseudouridine55 synthase
MIGVINVFKEKGYTSHDVVAIIRKLTGAKTGHTGTLDPNAEGVLPICLGRATKLADYIQAATKTYVAEVILGVKTTTGDATGEIISQNHEAAVQINADDFAQAAARFVGEIEQIPPMYSAIKIDGKKLYDLARKGEEIVRKPRVVQIEKIELCFHADFVEASAFYPNLPRFFIEVSCSKGTYIRTLCEDIGAVLGCGATMGALTRTRSGHFFLENALRLDELREATQAGRLGECILPVDAVLPFPKMMLPLDAVKAACNGNAVRIDALPGEKYWLCAPDGDIIGLFAPSPDENLLRAQVML